MNQSIYLRRKRKVFVPQGDNNLEYKYIQAFEINIYALGYKLSDQLKDRLKTLSIDRVDSLYKEVLNAIKEIVGDHVEHKPMYPNFPQQVIDASNLELYGNALMHYVGDAVGRRIMPNYIVKERGVLSDNIELKEIGLGSKEEFESIFTDLLLSKVSASETDKEDIKYFVKNYNSSISELIPEKVPNKENVAFAMSLILRWTDLGADFVERFIKTPTDVLRLSVALSDGDISLAKNTRFKNFSRLERRTILGLLESMHNITEELIKYKEVWKRLAEKLHPSDKRFKFPLVVKAISVLRNDTPFETYYGKVQKLINFKQLHEAALLLSTRPGELARKLDYLLRSMDAETRVSEVFEEVSDKVSTPVLLGLLAHFENRNNENPLRVFFPKGGVAKAYAIPNNLPKISESNCEKVVEICKAVLINRFKTLPSLGNVYIDEGLKNFMIPFGLRSASKSLKTVGRGSKFTLPQGDIIRFFLWWKDGRERTDIDLSAVGLGENFSFKKSLSYYNLKEEGGYHSGDITSAPDGASEFIDINIPQFVSSGVRYLVMSINSYTQQPYCDLPECFAGFMSRQSANSGEIYEPRTVDTKIDISSDTKICIPVIIDLVERKVVWTDLALTKHPSLNNVNFNLSGITIMSMAMMSLAKPTLYQLFELHALARGLIVNDISKADIVFSEKEGITPYDTLQITSKYL